LIYRGILKKQKNYNRKSIYKEGKTGTVIEKENTPIKDWVRFIFE